MKLSLGIIILILCFLDFAFSRAFKRLKPYKRVAHSRHKRGKGDQIFPNLGPISPSYNDTDDELVFPTPPAKMESPLIWPTSTPTKPEATQIQQSPAPTEEEEIFSYAVEKVFNENMEAKPYRKTLKPKKLLNEQNLEPRERHQDDPDDDDEDEEDEGDGEEATKTPLKQFPVPEERVDYFGPRTHDFEDIINNQRPEDCYVPAIINGEVQYNVEDDPPCATLEQTDVGLEPIPYINYKGSLEYGEECWLPGIIHDAQLVGISTTPGPHESVDGPLNAKREIVEAGTCKVGKGLECTPGPPMLTTTPITVPGQPPSPPAREIYGTCQCMNGFGRTIRKRVVIDGRCYIPAELGYHSECKSVSNAPNYTLPSGDPAFEKNLWNLVGLPCVPNAKCVEHYYWYERRCACKKGYKKNKDKGTCDTGTIQTFDKLVLCASLTFVFIVLQYFPVFSLMNIWI